jgi:hypothetical protein
MKKETLEELALDFYPDEKWELMERIAFKRGYIECEERMYSDMQEYAEFCIECDRKQMPLLLVQDWYEHYKKK